MGMAGTTKKSAVTVKKVVVAPKKVTPVVKKTAKPVVKKTVVKKTVAKKVIAKKPVAKKVVAKAERNDGRGWHVCCACRPMRTGRCQVLRLPKPWDHSCA